jgi:hypothetical protein
MKRLTWRSSALALIGLWWVESGCSSPQPPLQCNVASYYWMKYTKVSGSGTCSAYEGDVVTMERYLPPAGQPGSEVAKFALAPYRVTNVTRMKIAGVDRLPSSAPDAQRESAIGTFAAVTPDGTGLCTATEIVPTDVHLAEIIDRRTTADGGIEEVTLPATHIKYDWSHFELVNDATYVSTIFSAELEVTVDDCTARYQVAGLAPVVACDDDDDCNPDPTPKHAVGSGLQKGYQPVCSMFGDPAGPEAGLLGAKGACVATKTVNELVGLGK